MKDFWKYFLIVMTHKWFVLKFGRQVGGVPFWRLVIHDWTKFRPSEYRPFIKRHIRNECAGDEWKRAYALHAKRNPHHLEYWDTPDELLAMPEPYIREMVADWMAAGESYPGSQTLQSWLERKAPSMKMHPITRLKLTWILGERDILMPPSKD